MICRDQSDRGPLEEKEKKEEKCGLLLTGRLDGARQKNDNGTQLPVPKYS